MLPIHPVSSRFTPPPPSETTNKDASTATSSASQSVGSDIPARSRSLSIPLSMVNFLEVDKNASPTWINAHIWKNIPLLTIITSPNGSGKSHLLAHIRAELSRQGQKFTCLYKPSNPLMHMKEYRYQESFLDSQKGKESFFPVQYPQLIPEEEKAHCIATIRQIYQQKATNVPIQSMDEERLKNIALGFYETYKHRPLESIQDDEIWQYYTRPYIDGPPKDANAFTVLHHIFESYISRCQGLKGVYRDITYYSELVSIYESQEYVHENKKPNVNFFAYIKNKDNLDFLLNYIVNKNMGISPWEEINTLFKNNEIDLQIVYERYRNSKAGERQLSNFFFTRHKGTIEAEQLSSGERLILEMLSWQYYMSGLSSDQDKKAEVKKVDILLLDEPDRHFDPQLIKIFMACLRYMSEKNGVQIIMTTHRTDTLTLAPEGSIFTIKKDHEDRASIVPSHRLNALFKLTPNLRTFTNFHIKVYTESLDDATFYSKVYTHLLNLSMVRRKGVKRNAENKEATLSQRFQLSFYSLALDRKGAGGGCAMIPLTVQRDIVALENLRRYAGAEPPLYDSRITHPLGLIDADMDLDVTQTVSRISRIKDVPSDTKAQLFFTKRASLENYLYDPAFLFSLISEEEIETWITKDVQFKQHVLACQQAMVMPCSAADNKAAVLQAAFSGYFRYFIESFVSSKVFNIKNPEQATKVISKMNYQQLYGYLQLDQKASSSINTQIPAQDTLQTKAKTGQKGSKKTGGPELLDLLETLAADLKVVLTDYPNDEDKKKAIVDKLMQAQSKAITILSADGKETYTIQYPGFFIYIQGHTLEEFIQKTFAVNVDAVGNHFKQWVINKVAVSPEPLTLPMDLVEVIRELNARARVQANAVIKPHLH